jgi:uncharacterized circularly permuted ATP-grasp superfamily protein
VSAADELRGIVDEYHAGLGDELAAESWAWLNDQLARRGLRFGDRPICTVLRPRFLLPSQWRLVRREGARLLAAFARALEAALADEALRAQFALEEWEERLAMEEPRIAASPVSRLDAFFAADGEGFAVTEYNAETPAGAAYADALSELFLALPAMRGLLRRREVRTLPARHSVLHALRASYERWLGRREAPSIGILDWREVPTYSEFVLYDEYFRSFGLSCVIADPRDVDYRGGRLFAAGRPITLIYKRVLIHELVAREGLESPVVRAVRDGAVCMVNPFRCKLLHKKASLAVLSDERNAGLFSDEQRAAILAHVPWTRRVEERWTEHEGRRVDLVPHLLASRERMVLKPNDDYGGHGVVLGWECDEAAWEAAVRRALAVPYVAQERLALPEEPYPTYAAGTLDVSGRIVDTAPFVFDGAGATSCLTRVSTASLVNVTAGGGSTVPTFVVEG